MWRLLRLASQPIEGESKGGQGEGGGLTEGLDDAVMLRSLGSMPFFLWAGKENKIDKKRGANRTVFGSRQRHLQTYLFV